MVGVDPQCQHRGAGTWSLELADSAEDWLCAEIPWTAGSCCNTCPRSDVFVEAMPDVAFIHKFLD